MIRRATLTYAAVTLMLIDAAFELLLITFAVIDGCAERHIRRRDDTLILSPAFRHVSYGFSLSSRQPMPLR